MSYTVGYDTSSGLQWIRCHACGKKSYNPNDVGHLYCGNCHEFFDDWNLDACTVSEWVDEFGYNQYGALLEGGIEKEFSLKSCYLVITLAKGRRGWHYGIDYGISGVRVGCGGGVESADIDTVGSESMEQALIAGLEKCIDRYSGHVNGSDSVRKEAGNFKKYLVEQRNKLLSGQQLFLF